MNTRVTHISIMLGLLLTAFLTGCSSTPGTAASNNPAASSNPFAYNALVVDPNSNPNPVPTPAPGKY